ncbi:hypothetical protein EIN_411430 [Entamoeba invadens IP1]|uniref:AAA+ ATPase domain-containing protein n=1 Tax=Entamoeba invadens IP1 TaxID=370355 RepID=A0A0A1U1A8_ENTIV|nr:hypothetical protein EIN_411430 [Entamoeba invadens IP1]ELP87790.1 hypothetical protein EIN_411430 [Entamoeba invadens IP1]|eukprot:XP_004254561.1 hypothetical protein EIN_411430 [Entamoeba invadens IP1]
MADMKLSVGDYVELHLDQQIMGVFEIHPQPGSMRFMAYIYKEHAELHNLASSAKVTIVPIRKALTVLKTLQVTTPISSLYFPIVIDQLSHNPLHPHLKPIVFINGNPIELDISITNPSMVTRDTLILSPVHSPFPVFYTEAINSLTSALKYTPPHQLALRSFLITGASGSGKSVLCEQMAERSRRDAIFYFTPHGDISSAMNSIFKNALKYNEKSVVIIDNVNLLPETSLSALHKLDNSDVLLICTTTAKVNFPFQKTLQTSVPSPSERVTLISKFMKDNSKEEIDAVNELMSGYTHRDISTVFSEFEGNVETFKRLIKKHKPSGLSEISLNVPHVSWDQIGGNEDVKNRLREAVQWPLKYKDQLDLFKIRATRGILLHGPPGNSKTMQAKALATEAKCNFLAVKGPEMLSKYVGETEGKIKEIFTKARQNAPCVIFFDEIDGMLGVASERGKVGYGDRLLSQFLVEMDGLKETKILVLAATNRPDLLDQALLRPGRFDRILYVGLPDNSTRKQIVQIYAKDVDSEVWAEKLDGYSGAEIAGICREASLYCLRKNVDKINEDVLELAFQKFGKPQTKKDVILLHEQFQKEHVLQGF